MENSTKPGATNTTPLTAPGKPLCSSTRPCLIWSLLYFKSINPGHPKRQCSHYKSIASTFTRFSYPPSPYALDDDLTFIGRSGRSS